MALTLGFRDNISALDHFTRHGVILGATTFNEYLNRADIFLGGPSTPEVLECVRLNGELVRYNSLTDEFGVMDANRIILTYYKINLNARARAKYPTNQNYFQRQCLK